MKLYLLNAPPRAGKDTVAEIIERRLGARHFKLSTVLKQRTHALYNMHGLVPDYFEAVKDEPSPYFLGLSPRQAYIEVHERYWKPVHGPEILGEMLVRDLERRSPVRLAVISDAGSAEQVSPLVKLAGADNTVVIHVLRDGCEWDNRVEFELDGVPTIKVTNNGSLADLESLVMSRLDGR